MDRRIVILLSVFAALLAPSVSLALADDPAPPEPASDPTPQQPACDPALCAQMCPGWPGGCDPATCAERCLGCPMKCCATKPCDPSQCKCDAAGCPIRKHLISKLDLTEEQQQAIDAALAQIRPQVCELRKQLSAECQNLVELQSAPEPDEAAVAAQREKVCGLRHELMALHVREIKAVLTPDQQARFDELLRECHRAQAAGGSAPEGCAVRKCGQSGPPCCPGAEKRAQKCDRQSDDSRLDARPFRCCPRAAAANK